MTVNEQLVLTNNYSSRNGTPIQKLVLHTMEGFTGPNGAVDCATYFKGDVGASSHWCVDTYHPNQAVCGVYEQYSAWTQGGGNPRCLSWEQAGYASYSRDTWLNKNGVLLTTVAAHVREMCDKYQIPIRSLSASEAQDSWTKGICDHVDGGSSWGGHHDCGSGYPMDKIIEWAKSGSSSSSPPSAGSTFVSSSVAFRSNDQPVYACVWSDGKVNVKFGDGGTWIACDKNQSPARSGATITARPDDGLVVVYTNGSGDVCAYEQGPGARNDDWNWKSLKGDAK